MTSNESKNEMLVMVLTDLSGICKKLTENSAVPEHVRARAAEYVMQFNALLPARGKGTADQHFQGEDLILKIARFIPSVLEVQAQPAVLKQ